MPDVRDFKKIAGGKKDPCLYCGAPEHPAPLACPRILVIWLTEDATIEGIEFDPAFQFPQPDPPEAA